jgi:hypothetical protein
VVTARLEHEIDALLTECERAEADCVADYGEEMTEAGGWVEVTRAVIDMSDASPEAKREVLRMKGLDGVAPTWGLDDDDAPAWGKPEPLSVGIPYAYGDVDARGFFETCPVCGLRCYLGPGALGFESLEPADRLTAEDALTKGADLSYAAHYLREHDGK